MDYKEHLKEKLKDPDFKKEYEAVENYYDTFDVNKKVKEGLNEVKFMREGKIKPKTLKGFLRKL
ncbi:MAG: hypothetical protein HY786_05415 [Deltaproteobacteria bacterium]|nr:hypothetical protein [Deltaproteobacteria bacterium]